MKREMNVIKTNNKNMLYNHLNMTIPNGISSDDITIVCIGTDRSTGDSLGPLIGTQLKNRKYKNIIGTLDDPCHAQNLSDKVESIPQNKYVIAVDACLGQLTSVGHYLVCEDGIKPGAGVNKDLGIVGNIGIAGVVNVGGFMEYFVLQNTRLSLIMKMAKDITYALDKVLKDRKVNIGKLEIAAAVI